MQLISLFSGIGGFELAAEKMGWDVISTCEIEDFPNKVLNYYWQDAYHHRDIRTLTNEILREKSRWDPSGPTIITGGFPCQPFSMAGARRGTEDDRYLWPEMFRIIKEVRPDWIVPENVAGITTMALPSSPIKVGSQTNLYGEGDSLYELRERFVLNQIIDDFESIGYTVAPLIIPAEAVGAPHRRERIWIVANASSNRRNRERAESDVEEGQQTRPNQTRELERRLEGLCDDRTTPNTECERQQRQRRSKGQIRTKALKNWETSWTNINGEWPTQPPVCSGDDGVPSRLYGITFPKWRNESIKAYGNAIVPQVAFELFKAIENSYNQQNPPSYCPGGKP